MDLATYRARIEQSNDAASIVYAEFMKAYPDLHPGLTFRYGVADALWDAGFRKVTDHTDGSRS